MVLSISVENLIVTSQIQLNKNDFNPYEYMNDFKNFKKQSPNKKNFYSSLTGQKKQ